MLIGGGDLPEDYHLAQFHFHWGSQDDRGSEHYLDGMQYPMEVSTTSTACSTPWR